GLRAAFKVGSNSSLRVHCRQHFAVYEKYCKDKGIEIRQKAKPADMVKAEEVAAKKAE
ncbi:hypothetical protein BDZ89DRAFT_883759, partial [Hymenopellis radicata]